jgi:hypothetical protein
MEEEREGQVLRVEDVLRPYVAPVMEFEELQSAAASRIAATAEPVVLARNRDGLWAQIELQDLRARVANREIETTSQLEKSWYRSSIQTLRLNQHYCVSGLSHCFRSYTALIRAS